VSESAIGERVNAPARRALWLIISLALLIVAGLGLHRLATLVSGEDLALVRALAGDRTSPLTALAHGASWVGRGAVLVPCAVAIALGALLRRRPAPGLAPIVGVLGAIIIQTVDKALVARPRPPVHELEHVSGTSFPSGHATDATAFFLALAIVLIAGSPPRWARIVTALAALVIIAAVAMSRVYLGVHYPTDVVAGILLGAAWGMVSAVVLRAAPAY
jgi:undecaprenyl-diphosphatase